MNVDLIAGARPNFIKIAPIIDAINAAKKSGAEITFRLIHTGQHYDRNMSESFFDQLNIPKPDHNLGAGGGSQAEQTAQIMIGYERLLRVSKPDVCLVVGDVTSTMACAIVAQKEHVKVAHVEAGIRSGDWKMPEEINRLVTDSISNFFFTTTKVASENLVNAGVPSDKIFWVGNTMIDTLLKHMEMFIQPDVWTKEKLSEKHFFVLTLHRPSNVDNTSTLRDLLDEILLSSNNLPVIFPVHPRTAKMLKELGYDHSNLITTEPLSYLEFNFLVKNAKAVITDSGGITEETTVMGVPCMTLRDSTERPETVEIGTNLLLGTNPKAIKGAMNTLFQGKWKRGQIPELWDGLASERIIDILLKNYRNI